MEDSYYDLGFSTGISRLFPSVGLGLGVGLTYVREHSPVEDGTGVVFSVGATYQRGANRIEISAQDIGGDLKFPGRAYPIDSRYSVGYGRSLRMGWGSFDVGAQVTASNSEQSRLQLGAAYLANPFLTIRTGVDHVISGPSNAQMPISAGLGFHFGHLTLDYAYTSQEYFSSTHTIAFAYAFGRRGEGARAQGSATSSAAAPPESTSTR